MRIWYHGPSGIIYVDCVGDITVFKNHLYYHTRTDAGIIEECIGITDIIEITTNLEV